MGKQIEFKVAYHGGTAEDGRLELYAAGRSLMGLSRALTITTHAFLNDGAIRVRGDRLHGAELLLSAPVKGSFMENVSVVFDDSATEKVGKSNLVSAFYDFLKWTWNNALGGTNTEPETAFVKDLANRQEPFISDMATGLETSLREFHRPIHGDREITIVLSRPRVGELLRLDANTLEYVAPYEEQDIDLDVLGNVTKYNTLSGYGRFFDDNEGRTVPFDLAQNIDAGSKRTITESLHEWNVNQQGKISIDVRRILTSRGHLKRYTVVQARPAWLQAQQ